MFRTFSLCIYFLVSAPEPETAAGRQRHDAHAGAGARSGASRRHHDHDVLSAASSSDDLGQPAHAVAQPHRSPAGFARRDAAQGHDARGEVLDAARATD